MAGWRLQACGERDRLDLADHRAERRLRYRRRICGTIAAAQQRVAQTVDSLALRRAVPVGCAGRVLRLEAPICCEHTERRAVLHATAAALQRVGLDQPLAQRRERGSVRSERWYAVVDTQPRLLTSYACGSPPAGAASHLKEVDRGCGRLGGKSMRERARADAAADDSDPRHCVASSGVRRDWKFLQGRANNERRRPVGSSGVKTTGTRW